VSQPGRLLRKKQKFADVKVAVMCGAVVSMQMEHRSEEEREGERESAPEDLKGTLRNIR
jgi:hypothetical protein